MQYEMFRFWPAALLLWLPAMAGAEDPYGPGEDPGEAAYTWVDESHSYASNQVQALAEWMDSFFHDPDYEFEQPESRLRIEWSNSWDEMDDERSRVRLRGRLQLPALSRRLGIVFSGDDTSEPGLADEIEDEVGLQYSIMEHFAARLDATVAVSSSNLTPGVRYRYQDALAENLSFQFRQRLDYNTDERFHAESRLDFNYRLADDELVRWSNRADYGEETDGTEWRSQLSLRHRLNMEGYGKPFVMSYFASIRGITDPDLTKSYGLGFQVRRQIFRKFLFAELEPTYSWRKGFPEDDRDGAWRVVLRFELALQSDLTRKKPDSAD